MSAIHPQLPSVSARRSSPESHPTPPAVSVTSAAAESTFGAPSSAQALSGSAPAVGVRSPLFQADSVLEVTIEAAFEKLFAQKGIARIDKSIHEQGVLSTVQNGVPKTLRFEVRTRGAQSLALPFPKLKLKALDETGGTLFEKAKSVGINTHQTDEKDTPETGLFGHGILGTEEATHRQGLAHRVLERLGIPTNAARTARITYTDTGTGLSVTRDAVFLEDTDALAKRLGGKEWDTEDIRAELAEAKAAGLKKLEDRLGEHKRVRAELAEVLLGNWDYDLAGEEHSSFPHNIDLIQYPNGMQDAVLNDFDMSSFVTNRVHNKHRVPGSTIGEGQAPLVRQALEALDEVVEKYPLATIRACVAEFAERKDAVLDAIAHYPVDEKGRTWAKEQVEAFFIATRTL